MAVLSDQERAEITAKYMEDLSRSRTPIPVSKAELRAAVNATDDWQDQNAAGYNAALPQPARGALSTAEKSNLFTRVSDKRYKRG